MTSVVIVDAVRTPVGRRNGVFKDYHPVDLASIPLQALAHSGRLDTDSALGLRGTNTQRWPR